MSKISVGLRFCFFSPLINIVCRKCVFKASERLIFSLFIINQYCTPNICYTTKNVFKNLTSCLLVYCATFLIQKIRFQNKQVAGFQFIKLPFVILNMRIQNMRGLVKWKYLKKQWWKTLRGSPKKAGVFLAWS